MIFTLEVLPAQEGDCLLLHYGTARAPRLAIIDGGPRRVYEEQLRPRLEAIRAHRAVESLDIDLVVVSHVDNDHIVGVKKLFAELQRDLRNAKASPFRVKRLWHNTFNDILGDAQDAYYQKLAASFVASADGTAASPEVTAGLKRGLAERQELEGGEAAEVARDIALVLAGHGEGRALRNSYGFLREANAIGSLNHPFKKGGKPTLVTAEGNGAAVPLDNLEVQVCGPLQPEIDALQNAFDKYIEKKGLSAEAVLSAYSDKSVPNLSSIVCLVRGERGKKVLLTGDARGDRILAALAQAKLLGPKRPLKVDVLKVPHHGSSRNVEPDFFRRVVARRYVLSGDGKYGNPDRETIEMILGSRRPSAKLDLIFTYPVADIDRRRKEDSPQGEAGPWKDSTHSIAWLLEAKKKEGYKFRVIEGAPLKLDLGKTKVTW